MNCSLPRRCRVIVALTLILTLGMTLALAAPASATPPSIPNPTEAQWMLARLTVAPKGSSSGYSRDQFPHWITISGTCNTREWVLHRDGVGVRSGSDCYPTSGSWPSPYYGATWYHPADVDIDHVVSLAEAWRSGASGWTSTGAGRSPTT